MNQVKSVESTCQIAEWSLPGLKPETIHPEARRSEVFTLPGLIHMESMESMESLLAEASANLLFHGHHGFHVE